MSLNLTKEEKSELKVVIREEMVELRNDLTNIIKYHDENVEMLDNDVDCCKYEIENYAARMIFYLHIHDMDNSKIPSSDARKFWGMDTEVRDQAWKMMEQCLSSNTFKKIEEWLNKAN